MTTLVLIHSAGGNEHSYDALLPFLRGIDVRVPALPGRSGVETEHPGTIGCAAEWVRGWLEENAIERAVVGGHSMGGAVALELGLSAAPAVAAIALISTGARLRVHPEILQTLASATRGGEAPDLSKWLLPDPARERTAPRAAELDWKMADGFDRLDSVANVRVPALVVSGADDRLTPPRYAAFLHEHLPRATRVTIPGAGHDLPIQRPRELAEALLEFVATAR